MTDADGPGLPEEDAEERIRAEPIANPARVRVAAAETPDRLSDDPVPAPPGPDGEE
ncbi:hypothetical protein [Melissospora conviva]|uniref:hypothetical protein n=1 Tax=Melissospora conviva TaxID=3388432 RepID=UPI003B778A0E